MRVYTGGPPYTLIPVAFVATTAFIRGPLGAPSNKRGPSRGPLGDLLRGPGGPSKGPLGAP